MKLLKQSIRTLTLPFSSSQLLGFQFPVPTKPEPKKDKNKEGQGREEVKEVKEDKEVKGGKEEMDVKDMEEIEGRNIMILYNLTTLPYEIRFLDSKEKDMKETVDDNEKDIEETVDENENKPEVKYRMKNRRKVFIHTSKKDKNQAEKVQFVVPVMEESEGYDGDEEEESSK